MPAPGKKRFPGIGSSWKNSGPVHSWSLLRLSEFGAGTVNGYGRLTGHRQIECGERVWMLRRAVPVCEGCAEFGNCTAGQSMSDVIAGHSIDALE
jgi:hypothetical protein